MNEVEVITSILEKVNKFYEDAWAKNLFTLSSMLILIGIIIPIVVQYIQIKRLKDEKENIIQEMKAILENDRLKKEKDNKEIIEKIVSEKIDAKNKKVYQSIYSVTGMVFHIIGNNYAKEGQINDAVKYYFRSAYNYLNSYDELNLYRVFGGIDKYINSINIEAMKDDLEYKDVIGGFIELLKEKNINGKYYDKINNYSSKFKDFI